MPPYTLDLVLAGLALALVHFAVPLAYYLYLKRRYLHRPWNLGLDPSYKPKVTVIVPTYNEAELIERKLDNIAEQEYPRDKLEVIVVDSASTDGTPEKVREWARRHPELDLKLIVEPVRRGMVYALNYALNYVSDDSDIVVFTDVDAFWDSTTLKKVAIYFSDPKVGAVTVSIAPLESDTFEETYRSYYNVVRLAESKVHSTPIHNGALVAFRKTLLKAIGGLPTYTGNDDSTPASLIAFMGYRSIQIDDAIVREPLRKKQFWRKVRRAQHLLLHFLYTKRYAKKLGIYRPSAFDHIWRIECFLHLANPWMLILSTILLIASALLYHNLLATILLALGAILLIHKPYRMWILNQLILVIASIRNLVTREIAWHK